MIRSQNLGGEGKWVREIDYCDEDARAWLPGLSCQAAGSQPHISPRMGTCRTPFLDIFRAVNHPECERDNVHTMPLGERYGQEGGLVSFLIAHQSLFRLRVAQPA
jgi:hypothetical protein